jgi:hypothetical protein
MSLVAYYPLDSVNDLSGNVYTLTNNGTVDFSGQGKFGLCANFGTANANKCLRIASDIGVTGNYTVTCWVKALAEIASGTWAFIHKVDSTTDLYTSINYEYNGGTRRLRFTREGVGGAGAAATFYYTLTMGTTLWYFIASTFDGTNTKGFLNGAQVGSESTGTKGSEASGAFTIGGWDNYDRWASIKAEQVKVYNEVLTPQAIRKEYAIGVGKFY